jgi:ataxia telangiectasia mutated family protein
MSCVCLLVGFFIPFFLQAFNVICSKFRPAFRYFFYENFSTPGTHFERRLAYTRSVATNSMIGYILGLGDRPVQTILVTRRPPS